MASVIWVLLPVSFVFLVLIGVEFGLTVALFFLGIILVGVGGGYVANSLVG